jgi:DNA-binding response OmpR family regulator
MLSSAPDIRDAEVLIVEDNPADARLLQALLEESAIEPMHFTHVDRLDDAREWLENNVADAVLLDLGLPDASGLESLTELSPGRGGIPVVIVSGTDDERLRKEAVERGAVDFVVKHQLDAERLARSLRAALEQSRLASELDRAHRSTRLAQAELAELVVQLEVPVVVVTPNHHILYANAAAGRLFGTEPTDLRETPLCVPVDRTRSRRVEITDPRGVKHQLDVSAVPAHWRGLPAYLVVMLPPQMQTEAVDERESARATLVAIASEISAHALRLGSALAAAERHHAELLELGDALASTSQLATGDTGQRNGPALRSVLALARHAREALTSAQDDLVRLRRLAMFAQRSLGRPLGDGERGEPTSGRQRSIAAILDEACRAAHARFGPDVHIVANTHGPPRFPANTNIARRTLDDLLGGLTRACLELDAGSLKLRIRTSGATNCVLVSIDAFPDRRLEDYRARVLRQLVEEAEAIRPDHELARASRAIRQAGGNLRCGSGNDGRLWLRMSLPDRGPN